MAPGGTLFRFTPHFGENVLPHGSHEWLPYSKDEVRLKTVNNNLADRVFGKKEAGGGRRTNPIYCTAGRMSMGAMGNL